ncbi:MAG TPA: hypothetical protein VL463_17120 [Kofleriaceae bacterium]|nr:hypothetical protein [Kofleriaceae bacterium]
MKRAIWGLLCVVYLWSFPYFPGIHSANETPRVYLVKAIADHGRFSIEDQVRPDDITGDMSPAGGHTYSNKAPGSSMLAVPPYWIVSKIFGEPSFATTLWICRVWTGVIPTLLFLILLWRFLARWAPRESTRRLVIVAYALGSMAMTYSILFIAHQLSAVCIGTAWIVCVWVIDDGWDPRWMIAAGAAAGAAPLVDYQAALAGVPIAIYVVVRGWRDRPRLLRAVGFAVAGAAVPIAILLGYHWACFGSPLRTGYDASKSYEALHSQGFLGLSQFRIAAFVGSFFAPDNGLFVLSPWVVATIPGLVLLWKRGERRHVWVAGSICILYVWFVSSLAMWHGGWAMGPRYITAVLPFTLPGVAVLATWADDDPRRWWARALLIAGVVVACIIYVSSCAEYPHFPGEPASAGKWTNPLYEITFRLIREDHAPWNVGWLVGLRGVISIVPAFLAAGLVVALAVRRDRRATIAGVALAIALVGAYALFPRGTDPSRETSYTRFIAGVFPDSRP